MFAQFRNQYPTGSLISELLEIHHNIYVVRCSAIVDGVTLATGLAADETIETAENRARLRALEILGLQLPVPTLSTMAEIPKLEPKFSESIFSSKIGSSKITAPKVSESWLDEEPLTIPPIPSPVSSDRIPPSLSDTPSLPIPTRETPSILPEKPEISDTLLSQDQDNLTQDNLVIPPTSSSPTLAEEATIEAIDLSDTIASIDVLLKRLNWDTKQENHYLKKTYHRSSRHTLTDSELFNFLHRLETIVATDDEMKRLGWNEEQGKNYLKTHYGQQSRFNLSEQELLQFLQELKSFSDNN